MPEQSLLNGHIQFDPHTGTLSVSFPHAEGTHEPWTALRGARAIVHYRLDDTPHRLELTGPGVGFGLGENLVTFSHHDDQLGLDWSWISEGSVLETWLEVSNLSDTPVALDRLDVLHLTGTASIDLPGPIADWRVYLNGWQSWAPSGVRRVGDGPFPAPGHEEYRLKNLPHGDGLRSEWVTVRVRHRKARRMHSAGFRSA